MRLVLVILMCAALAGCAESEPAGLEWVEPTPSSAGCVDTRRADERPQPVAVFNTSLGSFEVEVFLDRVPETASAFIDLVESGAYDGATFHYVETDYMMRVAPAHGDAAPVPAQYHHAIAHEGPGAVSMALDGQPGEFSILVRPADWLDGKQPVFGQVVRGLEIVQTINDEAGLESGSPRMEVAVEDARIVHPDPADRNPGPARFGIWVPDSSHKVATTGGKAGFLAVAVNCSDHPIDIHVSGFNDGKNSLVIEPGFERIHLASAQRAGFVIHGEAGLGTGSVTMPLSATTPGGATHVVQLSIERDPEAGGRDVVADRLVRAHYVGMVPDGRVFGTSMQTVADSVLQTDLDYTLFAESVAQAGSVAGAFAPVIFLPSEGMFEGVLDLTVGVQEGGAAAARIPADKAYDCVPAKGSECPGHLAGLPLLFMVEVVGVQP